MYSIPANEQETTISFTRDGNCCSVWTSDTTVMTKLDKLCESAPELYILANVGVVDGNIVDKEYFITDKKMLSFRSAKRVLTEEQKKKLADRLNKAKYT